MFQNWIEILLSGSFEEALPTLTLTSARTGETAGSGRFIWRGGNDLRIQAATRRVEKPVVETTTESTEAETTPAEKDTLPGELIPHSNYLTAVGHTQRNWTLRTDPTTLNGLSTSGGLDMVWNFAVTGACFSNETANTKNHYLRFLLSPCPELWTRGTNTTVENEFFGGTSGSLDWLMCLPAFGRVAAKQRTPEWFEVFVEFNKDAPECSPHEIIGAIGRSFSFFLGRQCISRGYEYVTPGKAIRRLDVRQIEPKKHTLRQPLGRHLPFLATIEPTLGPTIDFFLTEIGQRVAQYLFLCWDTVDNSFPTQQAISSICIEGMLRLAAEQWGPKKDTANGENDKKDENIQKLIEWLRTNPNPIGLTDEFVDRVTGMITGMLNNKLSAKDIQRDWLSRSLLGTTKDEFKAWSDTRQPIAHGSLAPASESQADLQIRVTRHSKILNLLNKMVLGMIGYQGEYIDYSQVGWFPAPFPAPNNT